MVVLGKKDRCPSIETYIFEIRRLVVDSSKRRRDPIRKFPWFHHPPGHQRLHELFVRGAWQAFVFALLPGLRRQDFSVHTDVMARKIANGWVNPFMGKCQLEWNPRLIDHSLPARYAVRNLLN